MTDLRPSHAAVIVVYAGLSAALVMQLSPTWQLAVISGLLFSALVREAADAGRWVLGVVGVGGVVGLTTDALGWGLGVPAGAAVGLALLALSEPLRGDVQLIRQTGGFSLICAVLSWAVAMT